MQVFAQTSMIVDGLRRCSESRHNLKMKPGRNLVAFLIISNLTVYVWDTFEFKSSSYLTARKDYYGKVSIYFRMVKP